jgi:hypothetical protein
MRAAGTITKRFIESDLPHSVCSKAHSKARDVVKPILSLCHQQRQYCPSRSLLQSV